MNDLIKLQKEAIGKTAWERMTGESSIMMNELKDNPNFNSIRINVKINSKNFFEFGACDVGSLPNQPKFPNFFFKPPLSVEINEVIKSLNDASKYLQGYLNTDGLKEIIVDHEKHYLDTNLLDSKLECRSMLS